MENQNQNQITQFQNELGIIRTMNINGMPYFVGKDVAEILGYENQNRDIVRHVDEEDRMMLGGKTQYQNGIELGQRGGWLINESGLYSLILSSKLPSAKQFKRWVTSEVLPSLRNNGGYITNQEALGNADMEALKDIMTALKNDIAALTKQKKQLTEQTERCESVLKKKRDLLSLKWEEEDKRLDWQIEDRIYDARKNHDRDDYYYREDADYDYYDDAD